MSSTCRSRFSQLSSVVGTVRNVTALAIEDRRILGLSQGADEFAFDGLYNLGSGSIACLSIMFQITISPKSALDEGIRIEDVDGLRLFKLAETLQTRLEGLLERNETAALSREEESELENLTELERFFTYLNARLIAQV
ncbi:MAG: hypothetical protein WA783_20155 [Phormidesmis sp.]